MARNLQINADLTAADQVVMDQGGAGSALSLSTDRVLVGSPGEGNVLLALASERSWVFKQSGSGSRSALELTAADTTNNNKNFLINTDGRVGVGTQSPASKLDVSGGAITINNPGDGNILLALGTSRAWVFKQTGADGATALELTAATPSNNNKNFLINTEGRVGIGTQTPRSKLDVNGSITVQDDVILVGADCAEEFDLEADSDTEPGTVMVITGTRTLNHSRTAYDRCVAGIVAGGGDARPGIVLGRKEQERDRVAIGLNGTTYCRVDASAHPIEFGDLLTTSNRPGYAMAAVDRDRSFGAVLGKALGSLRSGYGLLPVLVSLQ